MEWLIVSDGTASQLYVGQSPLSDQDIAEASERGDFIVLNDCRCVRTLMMPGPNGVVQQNIVSPIGVSRSGVRLRIKPMAYIRPSEDPATLESLLEQVKHCAATEVRHRLAESGLTLPGDNVSPLRPRG